MSAGAEIETDLTRHMWLGVIYGESKLPSVFSLSLHSHTEPKLTMNPQQQQQPMVLAPSSPTVITPRSSGTAAAAAAAAVHPASSPPSAMSSSPEAMSPTDDNVCACSRNQRHSARKSSSYRRLLPAASAVSPSDRRESLLDRIAVMRQQEGTVPYKVCDYFASSDANASSSSSPPAATPDATCRSKMVEWCTQVIDYCEFSRETVAVAMSYVDRYLSAIADGRHIFTAEQRAPLHDRKEYQLLCMSTLYTAVKIREPLEMDAELVAELSRGTYAAADISWMEQQLLQILGWRLAGPTGLDFCQHLIELALKHGNGNGKNTDRIAETMVDLCRCQTELATADYRFVTLKPSMVAVSAILNAIEALGDAVVAPTERLVVMETIRRATRIDLSARAIRACRSALLQGLVGVDAESTGAALAKMAAQEAADGSTCSDSSTGSNGSGRSNKIGRRESIGPAGESPVSVAVHGCHA